jgi:hypothetical protein
MALVCVTLLVGMAACGSPDARAERPETGRVVDSLLPRGEALRRFRDGLPPVHALAGGAEGRDELVVAFMRALGAADTAAIAEMAISRSEFGYLYYPTAAQGLPPYGLDPELLWFTLFERSNQGVRRALRLYDRTPIRLVDYDCGSGLVHEGDNTIHGPCLIRWRSANGDTVAARLFSQIIERGGHFKFLSYANRLE